MPVDAVSKSSIISKVLSKEVFELCPHYLVVGFKVTFMLVLFLGYQSVKKQSGKRDLVGPDSLNGFKVIVLLLTELIPI